MRVIVTGASGFAGGYLAEACAEAGDEVLGLSRTGAVPPAEGVRGLATDLTDAEATRAAIAESRPEVVYHLAAQSSVGRSWEDPAATLHENTMASAALLEALRHEAPGARVLWASSCEVYGTSAELPIPEDAPLHPENPYAVSKVASDLLAALYADAHGLDIVRVRPFSHAGPRQRPIFIASSLSQQAAQARRSGAERVRIVTGNPDTRRDFTDVRDVVRAYRMLVAGAPPDVYNVCSASSISAGEQVAVLAELLAPVTVEHVVDPARVRPHEVMDLRGSYRRLTETTGWEPEIPFRQTMADMIDYWDQELARA